MSSRLKIVGSLKEVRQLIQHCKTTGYASLDFETDGKPYHYPDSYPTVIGISFQIGSSWVIPLGHFNSPFREKFPQILQMLNEGIFMDEDIVKFAFNFKFEHKWVKKYGLDFRGRLFDVMLMKYLLDEERPNDLESLVIRLFPEFRDYKDNMKTLVRESGGWDKVPLEPLCKYNGEDSDLTLRAGILLEKKLISMGFYPLFRNLIMMAHRVLTECEFEGVPIDEDVLDRMIAYYSKAISDNESKLRNHKKMRGFERWRKEAHINKLIEDLNTEIEQIRQENKPNMDRLIMGREAKVSRYIAGNLTTKKEVFEPLNFASPKQMQLFFFTSPKGLKMKVAMYTKDKNTKKESDNPALNEEALELMKPKDKSGFIDALLVHRGLSKLYSTYMTGIKAILSFNTKIHCNYLIHGTVTGRYSSKEPNMQNIPRVTTNPDVKKIFIPPPGTLLFQLDYSQAELRVVAELSEDEALIDIFRRDYNVHVATACKMNRCLDRYDEVRKILKTPEHPDNFFWEKEKKKGKSMNFSILYQQSDNATAATLGVSVEDAARFKQEWFAAFPGVQKWIEKQKKVVKKKGYVETLFKRRRRLPDIYSDVSGIMKKAQRDAINAPIQSISNDYTVLSTIMIREEYLRGNLPDEMKLLLTVHDSAGYPLKPENIHWVAEKVLTICDNPDTLRYFGFEMKHVKMKVSMEIGPSWAASEDYDPKADYVALYKSWQGREVEIEGPKF